MTDKLREAAQMALDALTIFREWEMGQDYNSNRETVLQLAFKAEEILSAALAQPEQEPVAWWDGVGKFATVGEKDWDRRTEGILSFGCDVPLYTAPPQREWQGLTDEEVEMFISARWGEGVNFTHFIRAIEFKLKEKNNESV